MDGRQLINNYQSAMVTTSTVEAARYEAERTESEVTQYLQTVSSGRYLQPGALNSDEQAGITRASLDAHFKKVQAQQIDSLGIEQMQLLAQQTQAMYAGRRVTVTVRGGLTDVIEIVFYDQQTGEYVGPYSRHSVSGVIDAVLLDRNMLLLRPNVGVRLMNSRIQHYLVFIIDPSTLEPLVDITVR